MEEIPMTTYRVTVCLRRVYLVQARCAGDAMRWVMRRDREANWLSTLCERA